MQRPARSQNSALRTHAPTAFAAAVFDSWRRALAKAEVTARAPEKIAPRDGSLRARLGRDSTGTHDEDEMQRDIGPQMILAEWLFVETVDDVRSRSTDPESRSRYELLGIAPLLRKLILDASPLVNTVREGRPEIPVEFRIKPWSEPAYFEAHDGTRHAYHFRLAGSELVVGADDSVSGLKLKQFIRATVGLIQGQPLAVRDVIRYYAHVEGGVHFGGPQDHTQQVLNEFAPLLLGHSTGQIAILAYIGAIVVDALTPLHDSILDSPMIDRRIHLRNDAGFYDGHWRTDHYDRTRRGTA